MHGDSARFTGSQSGLPWHLRPVLWGMDMDLCRQIFQHWQLTKRFVKFEGPKNSLN